MRYLAVGALLAAGAAFGQQSDPASGVLVPQPPPAFYQAIRGMVRQSPVAAPQPSAQQPKVCAIPLTQVPVKDHIDDGIFLKESSAPVDGKMVIVPPAPACR
jgi:hypothetical protein